MPAPCMVYRRAELHHAQDNLNPADRYCDYGRAPPSRLTCGLVETSREHLLPRFICIATTAIKMQHHVYSRTQAVRG
jgi:hypothetical protein